MQSLGAAIRDFYTSLNREASMQNPMMHDPIEAETPAFGPCRENVNGDEHEFVDMGPALGPRRWRCCHCHKGQGELRADLAGIETPGE
ncbi:MAG: hypothetical protein HKN73_07505 [Gemmatimonadetes bacterium]|nr:hypothetical protein [Gemmatimonadota bacterium]